ncbi:MAG TPA: dTDP-4-dehydrorhamnose reductase [Pyrinomonadaceae bacterium]|nr:dTDP-4-dehydrorhamnose reductase [Pyrinomonadaceae bacterium]
MLVTGAGGMVGRAVVGYCRLSDDLVFAYDHRNLDIGDLERVTQIVNTDKPDVIINCAAWTDVDGCERDKDRAFAANAYGPENLAAAGHALHATLVTISTDYVFDGTKPGFYTQNDQPNPQSVYGKSKLEGEHRAIGANPRTVVVRTGFIFGPGGNNFLSTIVQRARRGEPIKAISDAFGTPTYALDLAPRLRELAAGKFSGVFHVTNEGEGVSYEEFAREALRLAGCADIAVEGVPMNSLKRPAPRPQNSRLRCLYSEGLGLTPLPDWRDSVRDFVQKY